DLHRSPHVLGQPWPHHMLCRLDFVAHLRAEQHLQIAVPTKDTIKATTGPRSLSSLASLSANRRTSSALGPAGLLLPYGACLTRGTTATTGRSSKPVESHNRSA